MPETPNDHDDQHADQIDRVLHDAGVRIRATTETALPRAGEPAGRHGTTSRWIVPVAIVTATAAAVVAAVWIAGPATETVREAPADTGLVSTPVSIVDSLPAVEPVDSSTPTQTAPVETTPADTAPSPDVVSLTVTDPDFDGAGGTCLQFRASSATAGGCLTHDHLSSNPDFVVALADQAYAVTVNALDLSDYTAGRVDEVCGVTASALVQARWLDTSCSFDQFLEYFWFVAAPETPSDESTTYVVPPRAGAPIALEPIASALPDGYAAYHAELDGYRCLVVGSFPDPWREASAHDADVPRLLVSAGGTVFVVEVAPDFASVEVQDIAVRSVPIAGCTAPVGEIAAALSTSVMISGLICAGDHAVARVPSVFLRSGPPDGAGYDLSRAADGTWSTSGGGTAFPCASDPVPICEAMGVDDELYDAPLPIPPWGSIGAREHDLDPVEITAEVQDFTYGDRTAVEIAASVILRYRTPDANEGANPVVSMDDELGAIYIDIDALDDSIDAERFVVWHRLNDDGTPTVERAYRITVCSRGIAAPDLCV